MSNGACAAVSPDILLSQGWLGAAACATGSAHRQAGQPCADRAEAIPLPGQRMLLLAVDGAGSARYAVDGAHLVAETIGDLARAETTNDETAPRRWCMAAEQALRERAQDHGEDPRQWACTVALALLEQERTLCAQIGDGVVVGDLGQGWLPLTWPMEGEFANHTWFLDGSGVAERLHCSVHSAARAALVVSDGLTPVALHWATRSAHGPFAEAVLRSLFTAESEKSAGMLAHGAALAQVLEHPLLRQRCSDDLSIAVAHRHSSEHGA